jgi:hypothetical protein
LSNYVYCIGERVSAEKEERSMSGAGDSDAVVTVSDGVAAARLRSDRRVRAIELCGLGGHSAPAPTPTRRTL